MKKKILESNENENTTYQNHWNTAKAIYRGKFIAMSAISAFKKPERSQIKNLTIYLKLLEKQEEAKPETWRRQTEITKIRTEITTKIVTKKNHKQSVEKKLGL
jgi:hypothetical protein